MYFFNLAIHVFPVASIFVPPSSSIFSNLSLSDPSIDALDALDANLTAPGDVFCSSRYYGRALSHDSCSDAWVKMPRSDHVDIYVSRSHHALHAIQIPIRYQSDDGNCVIDIKAKDHNVAVRGDSARSLDISEAAQRILAQCIARPLQSGGSVWGFSKWIPSLKLVPPILDLHVCSRRWKRPDRIDHCISRSRFYPHSAKSIAHRLLK